MVFVNVKVKLTHVYTVRTYMNEVDMAVSTKKKKLLFLPRHLLCTRIYSSSLFTQTQNILPLNGHYFGGKKIKS